MSFSLDGEYSKRRYDQSVYPDSDSVLYDVGLFRRTSQTGRIGIQASTDTIDFSGISAPSYKIDSVSVRWTEEPAGIIKPVVSRSISVVASATTCWRWP